MKAEGTITPEWSGKNSSQDLLIPLTAKLVREDKQVIVFRETKPETVGCAQYLAARLGLPSARDALDALPSGDLSTSSERLRSALTGGVGFHNADLTREERQVLEEEFRRKDATLRVLVATTTLAMGVNTPASAVVIVGLTHPAARRTPWPSTRTWWDVLAGSATPNAASPTSSARAGWTTTGCGQTTCSANRKTSSPSS